MDEARAVVKVNLAGGIVSAGDLYTILELAENVGVDQVRFGNRQQMFFKVDARQATLLQQSLKDANIIHELNADAYPNIISSYVTEEVFHNTSWLREGVYKDIFDLFNYKPQLKVNIIGSDQTFLPFFNGNLNFITSNISNYWFLHIRFPKTNISYTWPTLIYSQDIPAISRLIEKEILDNKDLFYDQGKISRQLIYTIVSAKKTFITEPITEPLLLPNFQLPYYEGFNRYGNKIWLGVYRRNELYSIVFLKDVAKVCLETRIGQIYTTPWKSIIIKGIVDGDRILWDAVLTKHRINVRHASNELNWQLEDLSDEGLNLKHEIVKAFDAVDLRTYRLCFAIKTKPKTGLFGSVIIKKVFEALDPTQDLFEILYTRDFNPNSKDFIYFKKGIRKADISDNLIAVCDIFYEFQLNPSKNSFLYKEADHRKNKERDEVYQCKNCLTIYDHEVGDIQKGINPGLRFEQLGKNFFCPTCEAPKEDFLPVDRTEIYD